LAALSGAASRAFDASRLDAYRDALAATASLEQSIAADRDRARAASGSGYDEGYADAIKAARLATTEELRILSDALKHKLALYADEARFYEITQQQKLSLSRQAIDEEHAAERSALQAEEALGQQSLAGRQRIDT
jgi:hypothetical protein